jgi:hypothetical protein
MYKQFGVREICNVVFKTKASNQKVGNTTIENEGTPVIYFDSLKTSSIEGASTTVYAQGGRGNPRLIAWEGERTVTFTMEDALISPIGFAMLSGAGLVEAGVEGKKIMTHATQRLIKENDTVTIDTESGEPWIAKTVTEQAKYPIYALKFLGDTMIGTEPVSLDQENNNIDGLKAKIVSMIDGTGVDAVLLDYYIEKNAGLTQIDIEPDKFGGNFYIEAETLFRDKDGKDHAAEFIIPNGKIQSNFTFTMASSGDPSTFTFTVDAFPGYTKFDKSKKVMASLQIED